MAFILEILILFCIYGILALALNMVMGFAGMVSVTQAAFFGIGAYATAILTSRMGANFFVSIIVGMLIAAAAGYLIARVLRTLTWDYYVLGTIGFNYIVFGIFVNWESLTNGPLGITGIPRPAIFGISTYDNFFFLILCAAFLAAVYALCRALAASSFGRALKAIREDEKAISVFGYTTLNYKLVVFVIAAALAALAGSLDASYLRFIAPSGFSVFESVFILSIVILGGTANLKGSLLGALFLVFLPEGLRLVGFSADIAAQMRQLVYGALLIILMLYRPQGLIGEYKL